MAEKSSVKENHTPLKTPATLSRRRSAEKGPAAVYEGSGSQRRRESRFRGTNQLLVPESVTAAAPRAGGVHLQLQVITDHRRPIADFTKITKIRSSRKSQKKWEK